MTEPAINSVWVHRKDGGRWRVVEPGPVLMLVSPVDGRSLPGTPVRRLSVETAVFLRGHVPEEEYRMAPAPPAPAPLVVGSVVRLNSGGPVMTVLRLTASAQPAFHNSSDELILPGYAEVAYVPEYGNDGHVLKDVFPLDCLTVQPTPTEEPDASLPPR